VRDTPSSFVRLGTGTTDTVRLDAALGERRHSDADAVGGSGVPEALAVGVRVRDGLLLALRVGGVDAVTDADSDRVSREREALVVGGRLALGVAPDAVAVTVAEKLRRDGVACPVAVGGGGWLGVADCDWLGLAVAPETEGLTVGGSDTVAPEAVTVVVHEPTLAVDVPEGVGGGEYEFVPDRVGSVLTVADTLRVAVAVSVAEKVALRVGGGVTVVV
jgi:hypothetical protein